MWEILLACVNLFHGYVKIFVGMSMNKLVGMENFCWVCDVGSWKIL